MMWRRLARGRGGGGVGLVAMCRLAESRVEGNVTCVGANHAAETVRPIRGLSGIRSESDKVQLPCTSSCIG